MGSQFGREKEKYNRETEAQLVLMREEGLCEALHCKGVCREAMMLSEAGHKVTGSLG